MDLETQKMNSASHLIIRHLWVLQPESFFMSSTALLCLFLLQADVFGNWKSIALSQVFETLVDKAATLGRVELLTSIGVCSGFGPIALCTKPIFIQLLQEVSVSVATLPENQQMFLRFAYIRLSKSKGGVLCVPAKKAILTSKGAVFSTSSFLKHFLWAARSSAG